MEPTWLITWCSCTRAGHPTNPRQTFDAMPSNNAAFLAAFQKLGVPLEQVLQAAKQASADKATQGLPAHLQQILVDMMTHTFFVAGCGPALPYNSWHPAWLPSGRCALQTQHGCRFERVHRCNAALLSCRLAGILYSAMEMAIDSGFPRNK